LDRFPFTPLVSIFFPIPPSKRSFPRLYLRSFFFPISFENIFPSFTRSGLSVHPPPSKITRLFTQGFSSVHHFSNLCLIQRVVAASVSVKLWLFLFVTMFKRLFLFVLFPCFCLSQVGMGPCCVNGSFCSQHPPDAPDLPPRFFPPVLTPFPSTVLGVFVRVFHPKLCNSSVFWVLCQVGCLFFWFFHRVAFVPSKFLTRMVKNHRTLFPQSPDGPTLPPPHTISCFFLGVTTCFTWLFFA